MRKAAGLTALTVRTLGPGRHGDGGGLYLLVREGGARWWLFRYRAGGKLREMGLGRAGGGADAVTLAAARQRARDLLAVVRAGTDPLVQREAEAKAAAAAAQLAAVAGMTFRDVAGHYLAAHDAGWRNDKHRQQWRNTLTAYAFPSFGDVPVAKVETAHVMAALEPIWNAKPETASRVRGRIESVLDSATARGWRSGENPARWKGHLQNLLAPRGKVAAVEHHAALPWREVGAFLADLRGREGMAALALQFAILTAARSGEVLGARWSEIDMAEAVWTVPGARMKAAREHRVPLSPAALAVLRAAPAGADGAFVFSGGKAGKPLSVMAMAMVLRRMDRGDLTVHGFRSSFRDWCSEATNFDRETAEAALAHTIGNKVEAAYRRGDLFEKRRRLMKTWAEFCACPVAQAGTITPIRAAG